MLNEPTLTMSGNLTADPEMRYTPSGAATARFSLACNPRQRNAAGDWENGSPVFLTVICWRDLAENVCESLRRGDPALVVGRFRQRQWETREGEKRTAYEIQADSVAVPLDRRIVRMTKTTREHAPANAPANGEPVSEDWATEPPAGSGPVSHAEPPEPQPGTDAPASPERPATGRTRGKGSRSAK